MWNPEQNCGINYNINMEKDKNRERKKEEEVINKKHKT